MNERLKISFDFDGCLADNKFVQFIAKLCINANHDVWIITSRDPSQSNIDVWTLMEDFNIPKSNVIMTNGTLKVHSFIKHNFDMHFDNSWDEVIPINNAFDNMPNRKNESMPAFMVNLDSEELGFAINTITSR